MKKVLMIGAGRRVRGGVSSVVNGYYEAGLNTLCNLAYLPTMEDGSKIYKLLVAGRALLYYDSLIKKADILHVHMSSDASFHRKAVFIRKAKKLGKKIIIHMHGSTFDIFYKERLGDKGRKKVREIFDMADMVIALSEYWKDFLAKNICDESKIRLIYNAIPIPDMDNKDYGRKQILFMGLIGDRKGSYDLIRAAAPLLERYSDWNLVLCGDGEVKKAQKLCRELGIEDRVTFPGWITGDEKKLFFEQSSIYALPSYNEGMPMSVLEAMGYGLTTISTYVGGIPGIITDGKDGLLIEAGDVEALRSALANVMSNPSLRERLGAAGRERIKAGFDLKMTVKTLAEIYEEIG